MLDLKFICFTLHTQCTQTEFGKARAFGGARGGIFPLSDSSHI